MADEGEIAAWQRRLARETDLSPATIAGYGADARRCAAWLAMEGYAGALAAVGLPDARAYRDALVAARRTPATVNRALGSLARFLDDHGRAGDNPFRRVERIGTAPPTPQGLSRSEWNAVRRAAERRVARDHGLALALVCLLRYAGPRVGEVAALAGADVQLGARRGLLTIRQGKGRVRREVPLVLEAREPLQAYLTFRQHLAERWAARARRGGEPVPAWAAWPAGLLFLGQRGPLTARGIREVVAKRGRAAGLAEPLGPHALRHTFAKALLDPAAYGLDRPPAPITVVQRLLGHADLATTARYTQPTPADLARFMGEAADEIAG